MTIKTLKLSRHPAGSVREVLHIAFPLILAAFSANLMMFADRFILAQYSLESMNAVSIAVTVISVFQFGIVAVAGIAEVFVGQNNGAGLYNRLAEPAWQMIWLSLASFIIFIPLGLYSGHLVIPEQYLTQGLPFYKLIMIFVPLSAMIAAIAAFFTGQGKTKLVMYSTIVGNIVNLGLDIVLIFGIPNVIPAMGTLGAAIATVVALIVQLLILLVVFLNHKQRHYFNTADFHLNFLVLWRCIRIGLPGSLGHMVELLAWSALLIMMAKIDVTHLTIVAIGLNMYVVFAFITDGLSKGITAISANYLGANNHAMISRVLRSGLLSLGIIIAVLAIPMLFFPETIIRLFISHSSNVADYKNIQHLMLISLLGIWIFCLFDGAVWTIVGVLTAAGDTLFVMLVNALTVWIFSIIPIYFLTKYQNMSPQWIWFIIAVYSFLSAIIFYSRYRFGRWRKKLHLIKPIH